MKTINFEELEISMDISSETIEKQNVKKDFANLIYQIGKGIEFHSLALKIFNSNGDAKYSIEECELIRQASLSCAPFFIDAISNVLKNEDKHENN